MAASTRTRRASAAAPGWQTRLEPAQPPGERRGRLCHGRLPHRSGLGGAPLGSDWCSVGSAPKPPITLKLIPFGPKRRAETAAYARRHYSIDSWRLEQPRVIVQHYTASNSFRSAYSTFAADTPDGELGELPGVCAHFLDRPGREDLPARRPARDPRHTVGLNWTAFGIEHVGTSDQQILGNRAQLSASLSLTLWLMSTHAIQLRNVIGHNESLTSPHHRENYRAWRCQTHGDWSRAGMQIYRAALTRLARRHRVPLGPPARPRTPRCR